MNVTLLFTSRYDGDVRKKKLSDTVLAQQVHRNLIAVASTENIGKTIPAVDGIVYKRVDAHPVHLAVRVADCVPILAWDGYSGIIGAAHAGWRGTIGNIACNLISVMKQLGAQPKCIHVSMGPHIGICCYNIKKERALEFQKQYGVNKKLTIQKNGRWYMDIAAINRVQLVNFGIQVQNIEISPICTSCHSDTYFSYRKDTKKTFGEQMGVISV
jgi:YfiH family protein